MSGKTAAIIGATGMTGEYLQRQLLTDPYFDTIRLIVRRPYAKTDPKIEIKLVDFDDAESVKLALEGVHVVFCCIGTTQSKVKGDQALYRKIDFDIPVRTARFAKEAGCEKYIIITCVGANSKSGNAYLKLKGEVEETLEAIGLSAVHIMQPSVLLGDRKDKRPGERILQGSMKLIGPLMIGGLRKYRAVKANAVVATMIEAAKSGKAGVFRYLYDELNM